MLKFYEFKGPFLQLEYWPTGYLIIEPTVMQLKSVIWQNLHHIRRKESENEDESEDEDLDAKGYNFTLKCKIKHYRI